MLKSLKIKNFKLIKEAEFLPGEGFTVITGETGAGKSTLMGALSLLLGERADSSIWKENDSKCAVEAIFRTNKDLHKPAFEEEELDFEEESILRREITPSGKSRGFVNDTPVTLPQLKRLAGLFMDVHNQFDTLTLGEEAYQRNLLDLFANSKVLLKDYQKSYKTWNKAKKDLKGLMASLSDTKSNQDYNQFLYSELISIPLDDLDEKELEQKVLQIENTETILETLANLDQLFHTEDLGVLAQLDKAKKDLEELSAYGKEYEALTVQLEGASLEINDLAGQLDRLKDGIEIDPEEQNLIKEQWDKLNTLLRKHKKDSIKGLISFRNELYKDLQSAEFGEEDLEHQKQEVKRLEKEAQTAAKALSDQRKKYAEDLALRLVEKLQRLGMPKAKLEIKIEEREMDLFGRDHISFLFSANEGIALKEIGKAASGGEYSRIMLAVKSIMAGNSQLPTLLFDEIDSGVSGQVAFQVAEMLKDLSKQHQVIAITHMPQVAGKGEVHYKLHKSHDGGKTVTHLQQLDDQGHVNEIAKMIGGEKLSEASLASAKEMISA